MITQSVIQAKQLNHRLFQDSGKCVCLSRWKPAFGPSPPRATLPQRRWSRIFFLPQPCPAASHICARHTRWLLPKWGTSTQQVAGRITQVPFQKPSKVLFYYLSVILCITGVISLGKCAWIPVIGILSSVRNNLEDPLDLTDLLNLVFKILKRRISAKPNILLPARGADATAPAWLQLPLCWLLLPPHC